MVLKDEILKIDSELLGRMFQFAAHAINDTRAVSSASKELEIDKCDGLAFSKMIIDLGMTQSTDVLTEADYCELVDLIKS